MTLSSGFAMESRFSAAVRVNAELRSTSADFPTDALFPIYSITKTLTAICVLRLVEAGALQLRISSVLVDLRHL